MTGGINKYAPATLVDLANVVDAADRLYACVAEFPDDPECWAESMETLDRALEGCPGTTAAYCVKQAKLEALDINTMPIDGYVEKLA